MFSRQRGQATAFLAVAIFKYPVVSLVFARLLVTEITLLLMLSVMIVGDVRPVAVVFDKLVELARYPMIAGSWWLPAAT